MGSLSGGSLCLGEVSVKGSNGRGSLSCWVSVRRLPAKWTPVHLTTATTTEGTHPNRMHSCINCFPFKNINLRPCTAFNSKHVYVIECDGKVSKWNFVSRFQLNLIRWSVIFALRLIKKDTHVLEIDIHVIVFKNRCANKQFHICRMFLRLTFYFMIFWIDWIYSKNLYFMLYHDRVN